ncbi:GNAT family N-acetyltransferase [Gymnodinialimonas sp.]
MTPHLAHIPAQETERLTFRAPEAQDFEAFKAFALSERADFVGGGPDKDVGHAWRMLAVITGHWQLRGYGCFAVLRKDTGAIIGTMGPWHPEPTPQQELSWTIWDPASEGKGYAFEAVTEIRRHVYADLGWTTAVSFIDAENTRSAALATRLGCVIDEATKGPHPDDIVYRHPSAAEVLA